MTEKLIHKGASYRRELAHFDGKRGDENDAWCHGRGGVPCAFLVKGACRKPADFPPCSGESGKSVIYRREAADPFKTILVMHPKNDHECFGCRVLLPGVGSPNAQNETLREQGCAHLKMHGLDSNGELRTWRLCLVCAMAIHDLGYPAVRPGMFSRAELLANPKKKPALAYKAALAEARRDGIDAACVKRGIIRHKEEETDGKE